MASHWKQFQFFNRQVVDFAPTIFSDVDLTAATECDDLIYLSFVNGDVFVLDRSLSVDQFVAHEQGRLTRMLAIDSSKILVTLAEEDENSPLLKFWDLSVSKGKVDEPPLLFRSVRVQNLDSFYPVTALAITEDLSYLAVAFANGRVLLIRGTNIAKDLGIRQKVVYNHEEPITGLALRQKGDHTFLYITTVSKVLILDVTGNRENLTILDETGCALGCVTCRPSFTDSDLVVAREEAIYYYTIDGRGSCFAHEGRKSVIFWHDNYLIFLSPLIAHRSDARRNSASDAGGTLVVVFDPELKYIAHSDVITGPLRAHITAWGGLFLIAGDGKLWRLEEQDTDTKLATLFRANLYQLALQVARRAGRDENAQSGILRLYGDHLYNKADYDGAMTQYRKTIGYLEPSYVIRKFLDAQRIRHLTSYLQDVHARGLASEEHTTLLVNCYTKLGDAEKLEEFIKVESELLRFDLVTAIRVLKQAGYHGLAVHLAKKSGDHAMYLKIQMEDAKDYADALAYLKSLTPSLTDRYLLKYGRVLMRNLPQETTLLLIQLCVGVNGRGLGAATSAEKGDRPSPQKYQHFFLDNPDGLIRFLEGVAAERWSFDRIDEETEEKRLLYGTLLELYLKRGGNDVEERKAKAMTLLKEQSYVDMDQALLLFQAAEFDEGEVYIYESRGAFEEVLRLRMRQGNVSAAMECCRSYGLVNPGLYNIVLNWLARDPTRLFWHNTALRELLENIDNRNLLPPLRVLKELGRNDVSTIPSIRSYVTRRIEQEKLSRESDEEIIRKYRADAEKKRKELAYMQSESCVFQLTRCAACDRDLDLPALHFMCHHSFHQRCLGEETSKCPKCAPERLKFREQRRELEAQAENHERFFEELKDSEDGFMLVADYFGRNVITQPNA